ncbi:MAG: GNAT family N-acetyltransferase [Acidobacteriia bacterium]|nr:GNAT family N-acetyltransferase [Terriglobia bacterium]
MSLEIRAADYDADRLAIIDLVVRNLAPSYDEATFEWLYLSHPAGVARAWLAFDTVARQCIGLAAAFPRQLHVSGRLHRCWVLGDFCIDAGYRSLGPAMMLQRRCLEEARQCVALSYDFPSQEMLAVYKRMNVQESGRFCRFAKLLSVEGIVARVLPAPAIGRSLSALGNALLSLGATLSRPGRGCEVVAFESRFGEEFTILDHEMHDRFKICGSRSAAELNWRYREHPRKHYEVLVASRGARVLSYLVFRCEGNHAVLEDIFGDPDEGSLRLLLTRLSDGLRRRGIQSIHAYALETGTLSSILGKVGFRRRESVPVVIIAGSRSGICSSAPDARNWFLTPGDRDS